MTVETTPKRHRARWTASELNRLHTEYEMKELTVQQIAELHGRTVYGVMSKLQAEGLIDSSLKNARGWVFEAPSSPKQRVSLQPALQFDNDDDDDDNSFAEEDDLDDEDYVPEDDDDDEEDDESEFDAYSLKQKMLFLQKQITNIFSFLQKNFPKQQVMTHTP